MFFITVGLFWLGIGGLYISWKLHKIINHEKRRIPFYIILPLILIISYFAIFSRSIGFGVFLYLFILFFVTDIIKFVFYLLMKTPLKKYYNSCLVLGRKLYCKSLTVITLAVLISIYGYFNAKNIVVTNYNINLKESNFTAINNLDIVMISDTHVGTVLHEKELLKMLDVVNSLKPDIIFLCGDIFDENSTELDKSYSLQIFRDLKSKYGTYYVTGNHDNRSESDIISLQNAGIHVLLDETIKIADSFYVIGRKDASTGRDGSAKRKELHELMEGIDTSYPILLLDHQPKDLVIAKEAGIDLQLSGHTHAGQIFPGNIFAMLTNEFYYGKGKFDDYQIIVSSGLGGWGIPIRVGSKSEIVHINLN